MKDEDGVQVPEANALAGTESKRSEFEFLAILRKRAASHNQLFQPSSLSFGIGDDAAIVKESAGRNTVITTDLLIEDIDFHRDTATPRLLGHKALAVSLSDIAAMGARPRWSVLSVGLPTDIWNSDFVDEFYEGFFALADRYAVSLIGGDLSRTPDKIVIDSIVLGQTENDRAVLRRGAQPGDQIFVTGSLGGAAAGLRLLERGARVTTTSSNLDSRDPDSNSVRQLLLRQLRPEPRVGWGLVLGNERLATAMIDISDGLSSDIHHICEESGVGALIEAAKIPIDSQVAEICGRRALDPLLLALNGGEDFELLFTVAPENAGRLPKRVDGVGISCIGEIKPESEHIRLAEGVRAWDLKPRGWEHFRKDE